MNQSGAEDWSVEHGVGTPASYDSSMVAGANPYAEHDVTSHQTREYRITPGDMPAIKRIKMVAALQVIVGVLELLLGGGFIFLGFMMLSVFASGAMLDESMGPAERRAVESMMDTMPIFYWIFGGVMLAVALLRIASGLLAFAYRGRKLMIASLFLGLMGAFTGVCAPFSIGLCIFGAIVLFHPAVQRVFAMVEGGATRKDLHDRLEQLAELELDGL